MKPGMRHSAELLYLLVRKELKVRYKNSILGYLWALANPMAFALVYYVAFKLIMRVQMPNYSVFLLTGMFPWVWFANSLVHGTGSFRNNASLVKRVNLFRGILPLSNVAHELVHFCFSLPVLCGLLLLTGNTWHFAWLWQFPLMIVLQLALTYPVALMLAMANVYVHDVEYLVGIGLSLLFFLTPIVYPLGMVPETFRHYFAWSPIAALIDNWRNVFLQGELDALLFTQCVLTALGLSGLAVLAYRRYAGKLGELL